MNLQSYPTAPIPLQERGYDWFSGQPARPTVVQYSTVNITTEPPKDHIIWSLFSLVYSNPVCLGLAALIFSVKARDRKMAGDLEGARHYGSTARCLNIWATALTSVMILISVIVLIVFSVGSDESIDTYSSYNGRYNNHYGY